MCRIDYADSDGLWLAEPAERRARKAHRRDDCQRQIEPGETYTYGAWLDGGLATVKMCAHCRAAGRWLDVVCSGHLWPGVMEELREHWDEERDLRSHGLGRLVLCGEHRWQRNGALVAVDDVERWVASGLRRVPKKARA